MSTETINEQRIKELSKDFEGRILRPGDSDYEEARKVWNGMIDKHPVVIMQCANTQDVMTAITFARCERSTGVSKRWWTQHRGYRAL